MLAAWFTYSTRLRYEISLIQIKRPIGETKRKRAGICVLEKADVGKAAREAEDLPQLAAWRGEEDAEDPSGEERKHGRKRERLGPRQSRARPCELGLALLSGRRVVAAGAGARRLDVAARERHGHTGGGGRRGVGGAGGATRRERLVLLLLLTPRLRGMSRGRPHGEAGDDTEDRRRSETRRRPGSAVICSVPRRVFCSAFLFCFFFLLEGGRVWSGTSIGWDVPGPRMCVLSFDLSTGPRLGPVISRASGDQDFLVTLGRQVQYFHLYLSLPL